MNNDSPTAHSDRANTHTVFTHAEIARRAEELWRQYGEPQGRDEEIWFEAERQLIGSSGSAIDPAPVIEQAQAGDSSAPLPSESRSVSPSSNESTDKDTGATPAFTERSSQSVARSGSRGGKTRRSSGK